MYNWTVLEKLTINFHASTFFLNFHECVSTSKYFLIIFTSPLGRVKIKSKNIYEWKLRVTFSQSVELNVNSEQQWYKTISILWNVTHATVQLNTPVSVTRWNHTRWASRWEIARKMPSRWSWAIIYSFPVTYGKIWHTRW